NLYSKGIINNIIFAGGWRPSKNISGSELIAQKAAFLGVKSKNIFIETHSRDSIHNWQEAEKIINKNKFKQILLISSPFHLFRLQYLIANNNNIRICYGTYSNIDALPNKSFVENIIDYNYHMISFVMYVLIPLEWYQFLIEKIRK
ncbi:MAG: YdcF family protein, partial [Bacteroidales bacterium]